MIKLKQFLLLLLPGVFTFGAMAQTVTFTSVTTLNSTISETSGLINLDGSLITHNDGGNDPALYAIDTLTGNVSKTVLISGVSNTDWEDITMDDTYIYIGDIGNNYGTRTNLKVIRISISDFQAAANNGSIAPEIINYSYADQTDFTSSLNANDWDAESLIAYNDSLYIFTKNWVSLTTNVYSLPKTPGTYAAKRVDEISVGTLITGADYNSSTQELMLTSYQVANFGVVGMIKISDIIGNQFSSGTLINKSVSVTGNYQVEAVTWFSDELCYITSESNQYLGSAWLGRIHWPYLGTPTQTNLDVQSPTYANPVSKLLQIQTNGALSIRLYSLEGRLLLQSNQNPTDVSSLQHGNYLLLVHDQQGKILVRDILTKWE